MSFLLHYIIHIRIKAHVVSSFEQKQITKMCSPENNTLDFFCLLVAACAAMKCMSNAKHLVAPLKQNVLYVESSLHVLPAEPC